MPTAELVRDSNFVPNHGRDVHVMTFNENGGSGPPPYMLGEHYEKGKRKIVRILEWHTLE